MKCLILFLPFLVFISCTKEDGERNKVDDIEVFNKYLICAKLLTSFTLKVPNDYKHEKQIENFLTSEGLPITKTWNDSVFSKTTDKLIPGSTYTVKIFNVITSDVYENSCFYFNTYCYPLFDDLTFVMMDLNAQFVGYQGLTLAYQLHPDKFTDNYYASFDKWNDPVFAFSWDCFKTIFNIPTLYKEDNKYRNAFIKSSHINLPSVHLVIFQKH